MTETVSIPTLIGMVFTLIISIGLPSGALIFALLKTKAKPISILIGAAVFVIFALVLEQILHTVVLGAFGDILNNNIWLYGLYGGLAAAIFEETGRFLAMKFPMKKFLSKENAILYGIGHGGIESILLIGITYISNLVTSVMINMGQLDTILSGVPESMRDETKETLSVLWTEPSWTFYLAGIERISTIVLQICLSYIVYRAVSDKKAALFILALAIHFIVDFSVVFLAKKVSVVVMEVILFVVVAVIAFFTWKAYKEDSNIAENAGSET